MTGTSEHWADVRAVFEAALEQRGAAREALLAASGLGIAQLAEVRSLLAHHDEVTGDEDFLASSSGADPDAGERLATAQAGQRLGAWQVVGPLGSGGMGEVFEARRADGSYEGRAAVKLLKRGMDSAAVLRRFALERQALARLAHPHIARLLDAGASEEGLPYFVMEYVDGRAVHEAALALPLEQRLRLFLQLADAVAHAHRNLLVHRDLKPSNVLVDGEGQVKLLDFGIAKALDPLESADSETTVGGARPFTPHYASPEQVRGEPVTTATDIYSLGVLLYQMLTGARPTGRQATSATAAARGVLEEAPTRPSRLSEHEALDPQWLATRRRLEGDLDNILLKALEKQPERRYGSVDALAADVRAFLEGRPVSARPASPGYVLGKFVQRHRWPVLTAGVGAAGIATALVATVLQGRVAAALGVALLAAGLLLALLQARQAALARNEATLARDDARQQLDRVKRITTDLLFRYGDTVTLLPGGAQAQEALLRDSVALLEPALQGAPDDLDLLSTMVCALGRLAEIQGNITLTSPVSWPAAQATVTRGLALAERAWKHRLGDWRFASWHVRTLVVKAQLLRTEGRLQEAIDVLQTAGDRASESLHRAHGAEGRMVLAAGLANAHLTMAQLYDHANMAHLGRPEDALREYRRAEQALRDLLARKDDMAQLDREAPPGDVSTEAYLVHQVGTVLGGRALVHLRQENLQAMREEAEAAVALRRRNLQAEPHNVAWRDGFVTEAGTLALALTRLDQPVAALAMAQEAWDMAAALAASEGPQSKWANAHVQALLGGRYGTALLANGRAAEALPLFESGLAYWQSQAAQAAEAADAAEADAVQRAAWFGLRRAQALLALGRLPEACAEATHAAERLAPLTQGSAGPACEAWLTKAEAHALLMQCEAGERERHQGKALAALSAAQALRPLAADHDRLLGRLQRA
jgi:tetratricopeptide (TPR) repeat protein